MRHAKRCAMNQIYAKAIYTVICFRTTYVKDAMTYWTKTESITVSFVMEIPNSATSLSSVWAGLVAVSLLAFLMR